MTPRETPEEPCVTTLLLCAIYLAVAGVIIAVQALFPAVFS